MSSSDSKFERSESLDILRWLVPLYAKPAQVGIFRLPVPSFPIFLYHVLSGRNFTIYQKKEIIHRLWSEQTGTDFRRDGKFFFPKNPICLDCGEILPHGVQHQLRCVKCGGPNWLDGKFLFYADWATYYYEKAQCAKDLPDASET